jgi:hypothetical protein
VVLAASERDCRLVAMLLTAWQGRVHEASELIQAAVQMVTGSGRGMLAGFSAYASAVLDNGLGLYDAVRDAAKPAFERDHLGFGRLMVELAEVPSWPRSHLLYGEWLCRRGRRMDAREQLHAARDMLEEMGMEAFAERARRELRATGETIRKRAAPAARAAGASEALTAQEAQVAWLARDRLSNPEIGARLFISPRTSAAGQPASPAPRRHRPPG